MMSHFFFSILPVRKVSFPIQTLAEIAESNYYKMLVPEGTVQELLLQVRFVQWLIAK